MIKYNNKTINDFYFDTSNLVKVYRNNAVCYYKISGGGDTPTAQTPCYAVVDDISQYTDREFEDVFNKADESWYKLNNLNQYEKYGVYGSGRTDCESIPQIPSYKYWMWRSIGALNSEGIIQFSEFDLVVNGSDVNLTFISGTPTGFSNEGPANLFDNNIYTKYCANFTSYKNTNYVLFEAPLAISPTTFSMTTANDSAERDRWPREWVLYGSNTSTTNWNDGSWNMVLSGTCGSDMLVNYTRFDFPIIEQNCVTTYDGKLTIDDGYEYQYSGNSWVSVGEVSGTTSSPEYPLYYDVIKDPPTEVTFSSMTEALAYECPYVGLFAMIDGQAYIFNDQYEWEQLAFTITGTSTSYNPFNLKLNLEDAAVTVYKDNGDGTYNWGVYYKTPITNTSGLCSGNTSLRSFDWGDADTSGVTTLGNYSFYNCSGLTIMPSIPSNVTKIGDYAFNGCSGISASTITIPEGITSIGNYSFYGFFRNGQKSVNIPSTLTTIGSNAFYNSNQTVNVNIDSLEHWLNLSFADNGSNPIRSQGWLYINGNGIQDVTIPNNISQIKQYAFIGYKHLNSLTISSNVTSIGHYAFYDVSPITSVTIPSSVTSIGGYAFYTSSLKNVVYNSSAYNNHTFAYCSSLSSVTLSNITRIGNNMFVSCTALSSITIPSSVTYIDSYAFASCSKLSAITIPSSVTTFGSYAFQSCTSLTSVTIEATTPPTFGGNMFTGCTALKTIYVPCQSVSAYRSASGWSTYASNIVGYEECTTYEWQTVSSAFTCYEGDKYEKQQRMRSFDSGTTWEAVVPYEYQIGQLIESGSSDCGSCRLPSGYTELEYIENTTQAYINTGVELYSDSNNSFIITGRIAPQFVQGAGDNQTFLNSESVSNPYYGFVWRFNNNGGFKFDTNPSGNAVLTTTTMEDGSSAFTITSLRVGAPDNVPLGIFASYNNSTYTSVYRQTKGKLYSLSITLNDVLVRDFVPCKRDSDSLVGLYDLENNTFYSSPNSSVFSGGDEIPC